MTARRPWISLVFTLVGCSGAPTPATLPEPEPVEERRPLDSTALQARARAEELRFAEAVAAEPLATGQRLRLVTRICAVSGIASQKSQHAVSPVRLLKVQLLLSVNWQWRRSCTRPPGGATPEQGAPCNQSDR